MIRRHASAVSLVALSFCAATLVIADDAHSQPGPQGGKYAGQTPLPPPTPPQPQLAACAQFLQTAPNAVPIDGGATATSYNSVTLSISAPPGEYDVSSTNGFATKVTIAPMVATLNKAALDAAGPLPTKTLDKGGPLKTFPGATPAPAAAPAPTPTPAPATPAAPGARLAPLQPVPAAPARTLAPAPAPTPAPAPAPAPAPTPLTNLGSATLTNAPVAANFRHTYTIKTTLPDGRKGCFSTSATTPNAPPPPPAPTPPVPQKTPLDGWADLHTHPESHLAFGGHLFWGAPDEQSFMTINSQCQVNTNSTTILSAMGPENSCNNILRKGVLNIIRLAVAGNVGGDNTDGAPYFSHWPQAHDGIHQKMWWEWLDRARRYGKLRVMVGLSHNHELLAGAMQGFGPQKDKESSDLQIMEMKAFVARHPTVMEVAYNSTDLYRIASSGRIAVVLGVELDRLGNMEWNVAGKTREQAVADEVQRLYNQGVRYVLPIHLQDNDFGGTALYSVPFTIANVLKVGPNFSMECGDCADEVGYRLGAAPVCNQTCRFPVGHRNTRGLQPLGSFAIKEMMKRGMIVDIDHMSERTANAVLTLAEQDGKGYPLNSGHGGLRDGAIGHRNAESMRTKAQMERILKLGGMVGLGTDDAESWNWGKQYLEITNIMSKPGSVAIGTDANSIVKMPKATGRVQAYTPDPPPVIPLPNPQPPNEFPQAISTRTPMANIAPRRWTLASHGVANYGMMADFLKDVESATPAKGAGFNGSTVITPLMKSADYFWHMWERCEQMKGGVK